MNELDILNAFCTNADVVTCVYALPEEANSYIAFSMDVLTGIINGEFTWVQNLGGGLFQVK